MKKRITIHDIARMANVSSATVSRVLSNSDYPVSERLRTKIKAIAEEHNYIPNAIGKQLKTDRNMTIGVIIPSISNPFYASVMLGIEEEARKNGYHVFLCNSGHDGTLEESYLQTLFEKQVKGVVISSISQNTKLINRLTELGLKLVVIDQTLDLPGIVQIDFDYRRGGYMAASYLIEQGHRDIGYVSTPLDRPSRRLIYEGFAQAMREHGLAFAEHHLQIGEESEAGDAGAAEFASGRRLIRRLLDASAKKPTAVFACNDLIAIGVMHELAGRGVRVPEDISVMGFDDIAFSSMITPPLTTIKQPDYEMGKLACAVLMEQLNAETGQSENRGVRLEPRLIVRESVRRVQVL